MNDVAKVSSSRSAQSLAPAEANPMGWLRSEIDRLFQDFGRPVPGMFKFSPQIARPVPAMELVDDGKQYKLSVELPGMTDKDVEITVTDGVLTVSGEKKEESERKEDGYLLSERSYGSFKRQLALPADIQPEAIKARFSNGVLTITLGKDKKAQERQHKIQIES